MNVLQLIPVTQASHIRALPSSRPRSLRMATQTTPHHTMKALQQWRPASQRHDATWNGSLVETWAVLWLEGSARLSLLFSVIYYYNAVVTTAAAVSLCLAFPSIQPFHGQWCAPCPLPASTRVFTSGSSFAFLRVTRWSDRFISGSRVLCQPVPYAFRYSKKGHLHRPGLVFIISPISWGLGMRAVGVAHDTKENVAGHSLEIVPDIFAK